MGAIVTVPSGNSIISNDICNINIIISYKLTNDICNIKNIDDRAQTTTSYRGTSTV